jgi:hypothetical protein
MTTTARQPRVNSTLAMPGGEDIEFDAPRAFT